MAQRWKSKITEKQDLVILDAIIRTHFILVSSVHGWLLYDRYDSTVMEECRQTHGGWSVVVSLTVEVVTWHQSTCRDPPVGGQACHDIFVGRRGNAEARSKGGKPLRDLNRGSTTETSRIHGGLGKKANFI